MFRKKIISIITLGCSKNTVDSEVLAQQLLNNNLNIVYHNQTPPNTHTVIINTCGFINDAKEESINTILHYVNKKNNGTIKKLYITGCLSQLHATELRKMIPEVDNYFGTNSISEILKDLQITLKENITNQRFLSTPSHYAYIKIAEGCNRKCSFCIIPLIRGKYISKSILTILDETKKLVDKGVKEFILVAQDTSLYGKDLYKNNKLAELIEQISKIQGVEWIRLQYTYPDTLPIALLDIMKNNPKVCKYLDIPLQHISNRMLNIMNRGTNSKQIHQIIETIRKKIPNITLRTTLLVGHPGETKNDFAELKKFVTTVQFDRLGVFAYSHQKGSFAYKNYKDTITEKIKNSRLNELMELQRNISNKLNQRKLHKTFKTIIDRKENNLYIGRTEADSPEVDNEVIINAPKNKKITIGAFYKCTITDADDYDIFGNFS